MLISNFKIGSIYDRQQLIDAFGGSFMGGMNICNRTGTLVLISKHTNRRIYGDTFQQDLMVYTGEGQRGDQSLERAGNRKLYYSNRDNTPVHLFVVFKAKEYVYYGTVKLYGDIYYEDEPDIEGNIRKVIRFPLIRSSLKMPLTSEQTSAVITGGIVRPTYNVVGAAIIDGNRVLCCQRGYGEMKGKWEFPGGKIETGESPVEALKREIKEELNLDIEIMDKIDESSYDYSTCRVNLSVFSCKVIGGKLNDKEHTDLKYVESTELEKLDWANADRPIVDTLVDTLPHRIIDELKFDYFEAEKIKTLNREVHRACEDFEKSEKNKRKSGARAEEAVLSYERDKLNNSGRPDLADMVKNVGNDRGLGYDILSFEIVDGVAKEIHIEVKSTKRTGDYIEFFISENELRKFKKDKAHTIYCLIKYGRDYKLHQVRKEDFFIKADVLPMNYRIRLRISN